jgi:hypothetical protein
MRLLDEADDFKLLTTLMFGLPNSRSCFFEQPQFEHLLGDNFLQVLRLTS